MFCENKIFTLDENSIEFIAGDTVSITYQVLKKDGEFVNLQLPGVKIMWVLSPFGQPDVTTLKKDNISSGGVSISSLEANMFDVNLTPDDTMNISGTYIYQVEITDPNGVVSRRIQGYITIWPNVGTN